MAATPKIRSAYANPVTLYMVGAACFDPGAGLMTCAASFYGAAQVIPGGLFPMLEGYRPSTIVTLPAWGKAPGW
ncbi:MAG: hypothetical protein ACRD2E_01540 [Terriglobales bacterium]